MLIQCTKKLLDELKIKPSAQMEEEPLFSWHANILTLGRRKTVVLVNDSNRYVIVLYGLKAKDFQKIAELVVQAIREAFREESIKDEVIEQFLSQSKEISFTKTKDRTSVARMNKACETVTFFGDLLLENSVYQSTLSKKVSRLLAGDGKNSYIVPNEELYKDLKRLTGGSIFLSKAAVLHISLKLEKYKVWRKIVIPLHFTFNQLHRVIQIAFGWQDCHLYEFYIQENETSDIGLSAHHSAFYDEGHRPIVNIVCSEEAFAYKSEIPMKLETGIKLSEYLPAKVKYNYDFGDNWQHLIDVERVIDDYDVNDPVCLAGEGNTPPEDVGGEPGYEHFLEVTADPTHPEYEFMNNWGESQGYQEFDLDRVNWALKRV
jgi:hypothetical protein